MAEIEFKRVDLGNGVIYEGEIENGSRFVFGKYSFQQITYIGEYNEESDKEGIGKLTIDMGDKKVVTVGIFKGKAPNGLPMLNGYGATYFYNFPVTSEDTGGIKYQEGKYVNDELHGQGTTYYNNGGKYEGGFAHGRFHGKGVRTQADGTTTLREYDNGKVV